ncbi:Carbon-nitrogen hydrolase [Streptoalloteichus tenebrarius]|uniref:Carbon-nitrogen hydrolase n=1 Tax=Streptoalloteichus tenebrarius (strain ATCC 17920 / DSM 40477 / JCM 4838 / CBS 697.72 / NBRC 16177 / NCIMB 11028 / NRRL B-12390 / A12253. 1 / ISP 5477) TaxID=1933 RepID=A0ABT1I1E4_STRSD|nr:Carbon-nitrogen hydrolase [Streptoalloteichus tenebrarius]BFF02669.1 hypothetical protein GCM10020241_43440 [Streptoalloteichus tenebrarius]
MDEAARRGGRVVFPELSLTGYELDLVTSARDRVATAVADARLAPVRRACAMGGVVVVVRAVVPGGSDLRLASLVSGGDGEIVTTFAKKHLHGRELELFRAGEGTTVVDVDGWALGMVICQDAAIPEHAEEVFAADAGRLRGERARRRGHRAAQGRPHAGTFLQPRPVGRALHPRR